MEQLTRFIGLDVHKETIVAAVTAAGEVGKATSYGTHPNTPASLEKLVKRLREADNQIGSLALMDVFGRVARLLLETAEVVDGEKVVTKKLSKQDIARMIGASREMVSRVMKHLQAAGYIEVRADSIVIRDNILLSD